MKTVHKTIIIFLFLTTISIFQNLQISNALPGQDINSVVKSSEKHSYINKYKKEVEECTGDTVYLSKTKDTIYNITIRINNSNKSYSEEILSINNNKLPSFDNSSKIAIELIKKIYGATVSDDFQKSKLVQSVKPVLIPERTIKIYKGSKYLYVNIKQGIVLHPISDLKNVIKYYQNSFGEDC